MRSIQNRRRVLAICLAAAVVVLPALPHDLASAYERPSRVVWLDDTLEGRSPPLPGGNRDVHTTSISGNGRWVAFTTDAALVNADRNRLTDVYLGDMKTGRVELASRTPAGFAGSGPPGINGGTIGNKLSWEPAISANGRFVAFTSAAIDLVPGDTNLARDAFVYDRRRGAVERVSVNSKGEQAIPVPVVQTPIPAPSVSATGRYVSFTSNAINLVPEKTTLNDDIFVRDRLRGRTVRVSLSSEGAEADKSSFRSSFSGNGRFVAFDSGATNLVEGQPSLNANVYVHDLDKRTTERVSVASDGSVGRLPAGMSYASATPTWGSRIGAIPAISHDGRVVVFASLAANLVPNDANFTGAVPRDDDGQDVFVHDRKTGRTERVSVEPDGREDTRHLGQLWASSHHGAISADGRFVTFSSGGTPSSQPSSYYDREWPFAYVADRRTGELDAVGFEHLVRGAPPGEGFRWPADASSLSADGRYLSITTIVGIPNAALLAPICGISAPTQCTAAVWADRGSVLGVADLVADGKAPAVSAEGSRAFSRTGTAWINDRSADAIGGAAMRATELLGARLTYRPLLRDLYVTLEVANLPRTPALGPATAGTVYGMSFAVDGRAYEVRTASMGPGARGETTVDFGLYSCAPGSVALGCHREAELTGGFGTTGDRLTFSIPLRELDIQDGAMLTDIKAFTALGTTRIGPTELLDEARL